MLATSGALPFAEGMAGGIAAVVVVVGPFARWVWRRFVRSVAEAVDEILATTREINTQVTPNGGTTDTLADRVVRLERHAGLPGRGTPGSGSTP